MSIPLTKAANFAVDLPELAEELVIVDRHFESASRQDPARRWEYAMALRASRRHNPLPSDMYDVGGAGSPFLAMLHEQADEWGAIIDPNEPGASCTLAEAVTAGMPMGDQVFCISVLEHLAPADLDQFLYHLSCLVAPGGLLFLTMDCWDGEGPDTAHFASMRQRIFSMEDWLGLGATFLEYHFSMFPADTDEWVDWEYHGAQLYGSYSFASLALIKRS